MDPISQGALGAVVAASFSNRQTSRLAILIGWAGGMLADADVFIRSESDPLLNIEYHRHFSHSLLFIPVGALFCSCAFWPLLKRCLKFKEIYLYSLLGYSTAGLLDACTSYGTRLLWPFADTRVAWNIISIVDPVFTIPLLMLIAIGVFRRRAFWCRIGVATALAYLLFGSLQNDRATDVLVKLAKSRGHESAERFTVKPSIGNLVLWRGIYEYDDRYFVVAIRVPYFGADSSVYPGTAIDKVDAEDLIRSIPMNSVLAKDIVRFNHFSDGYLSWHPSEANVLGDIRYAIVPDSLEPLWGIRIDRANTDTHALFENFRVADKNSIDRLKKMVFGQDSIGEALPLPIRD